MKAITRNTQAENLPANIESRLNEISTHVNRANTRNTYEYAVKLFLSKYDASELNLLLFITELSNVYSVSSVRTYYFAVKKYFDTIGIQVNVSKFKMFFTGLENMKSEHGEVLRKKTNALTKSEILKGINEMSTDYKEIVWVLYYGAFRVSELLNIRKSDVSDNGNGYVIEISSAKNLKSGKKQYKFIPKHTPAFEVLKRRLKISTDTEKLFKQSRQSVTTTINRKFAGFTSHSLRAGFITDTLNLGASIESVCNQTGQTLATAQTYYRQIKADVNNAVNLL